VVIVAVAIVMLAAAMLVMADPAEAAQYGVRLGFEQPGNEKTYVPPTPVTFNLTIEHTGDELTEVVTIEILNEPPGWSHNLVANTQQGVSSGSDDIDAELAVGEVGSLMITIVPSSGMASETYWLTVRAHAKRDPLANDALIVGVTIPEIADFEISLANEPPDGVFKAVPPATVTLEFNVFNLGNAEDRFHIQVGSTLYDVGWVPEIISGVGGQGWTPILPSDPGRTSPHTIVVKVQIPDGAVTGTTCYVSANATSEAEPLLVRAPAGALVRAQQHYSFSVFIEGPDSMEGQVNTTVEFTLLILNDGNGADTFRIFAAWNQQDAPGWFAMPNPSEIILQPYVNGTVTYIVKIPLNASLGTSTFHAEVWSSNTELTPISKTFHVGVANHFDMVLWAIESEATADPGGSVQFDVMVRNIGNAVDSYNFYWVDWDESWLVFINPDSLTLFTNEVGMLNVSIRLPDDLGDHPLPTYTYDMRVESVNSDAEKLIALSVHIRPFGRVEWVWGNATVTSPDEPVAVNGSLRPKKVIDIYSGTTAAFSIYVRSAGVTDDNVTFWGRTDEDRITITVLPGWSIVRPGKDVEVFIQISVPDNMFPGEHRVWINASSSDQREVTRAVPIEFDVIPYFDTIDFADMRWTDLLEDDFTYAYSLEGNNVVSSRGRRGKHAEFDILSLTGIYDLETNIVTVTMEVKGTPLQGTGVFYGVYFVTEAHRVMVGLADPASHKNGDFVWESHHDEETTALMYLSDNLQGSSVPMLSLQVNFQSDRVVFTMHAKDLRKAGVDPGSDFRLYAYCHRLGSSDGGEAKTQLIYDTAGQGAVDAPVEFTKEPREQSSMVWIGVAVAVVAVMAALIMLMLPRLLPTEPEPEPTEADDWVEYK
jgi:uncharacterized membrane protein